MNLESLANQLRRLNELETQLIILTGLDLETLISKFAEGYILVKSQTNSESFEEIANIRAYKNKVTLKRVTNNNPCKSCTLDRQVGNPYCWQSPCSTCKERRCWEMEVHSRLKIIEDILGDEYDLDELRRKIL